MIAKTLEQKYTSDKAENVQKYKKRFVKYEIRQKAKQTEKTRKIIEEFFKEMYAVDPEVNFRHKIPERRRSGHRSC